MQEQAELSQWVAGPRERVRRYLEALHSGVSRNGWQIAEHASESKLCGIQRLIASASWDEDAVRDELRADVLEHLGDEDGVLVPDETGFLKK